MMYFYNSVDLTEYLAYSKYSSNAPVLRTAGISQVGCAHWGTEVNSSGCRTKTFQLPNESKKPTGFYYQ